MAELLQEINFDNVESVLLYDNRIVIDTRNHAIQTTHRVVIKKNSVVEIKRDDTKGVTLRYIISSRKN